MVEEFRKLGYIVESKLGSSDESKLYPTFSRTSVVFSEGVSIYTENSKYNYFLWKEDIFTNAMKVKI